MIAICERLRREHKGKTAEKLREELTELFQYDCPSCIYFRPMEDLQAVGFPVISTRKGDCCNQLRCMLPVLVKGCPELVTDEMATKTRDARETQKRRFVHGMKEPDPVGSQLIRRTTDDSDGSEE